MAAQSDEDAIRRIPEPERALYAEVRDASLWRNPYLMIRAHGIELMSTHQIVTPDQLIATLERSSTKWPDGRVVAVQEIGIRSGDDDVRIRRNLEQTLEVLEAVGIRAERWPSG